MKVDLLKLITAQMDILGIQTTLLSPPYPNITALDYTFRGRLYQDFDYAVIARRMEKLCEPGILIHIKDDFSLSYVLFLLNPEDQEEYHARYCCVGPCLINRLTSGQFQALMNEKSIPASLYHESMEFYNRVPLIQSYDSWLAQWAVFGVFLFGENVRMHFTSMEDLGSMHLDYVDYQIRPEPDIAMDAIEQRYKAEHEFLHAVSIGNTEQALALHQKFLQFRINPRTPDPIRNRKDLLITLNTLMRKAVEAGHVHPGHIDNLSTQLAIEIESVTSEHQISKLGNTMIRKYCMLVNNYSRKAYTALVQTCMDYTDFHYAEELSLDSLARMCSVSKSYLSALFKKEVGMTITDYINSTRIRQSLVLLNSTNLSIQDISYRCGFADSNYFTRTFKKFQGKSPKVYREEIRR